MTYTGTPSGAGTSEAGGCLTGKTNMPQTKEYKPRPLRQWLTNLQLHYKQKLFHKIFLTGTLPGKMISTHGCKIITTLTGCSQPNSSCTLCPLPQDISGESKCPTPNFGLSKLTGISDAKIEQINCSKSIVLKGDLSLG